MVLSVVSAMNSDKQENQLTIGAQEKVRRILPLAPLDPVDFLFNLKRFQVVEFWFM